MLYFSRWKIVSILAVVLLGLVYAAPNLFDKASVEKFAQNAPNWAPTRQMALGLDLQGGVYLLLQVDQPSLIKEKLDNLEDEMRSALRPDRANNTAGIAAGRPVALAGKQGFRVTIRNAADYDEARKRFEELTAPVGAALFGGGAVHQFELVEPEPGTFEIVLTEDGIENAISSAVTQSIPVIERRVNELGTTEPIIQRQGSDRILVQVPGFNDPQALKDIIGKTAKLTFHLVSDAMSAEEALQSRPPPGTMVLFEKDRNGNNIRPYLLEKRSIVSGEDLVDAQSGYDQRNGEPIVSFRFNTKGASRFGQVTRTNVGRLFAIVLDNTVISAPVIREAILGGSGQISGNFTPESANNLAILLRSGALPARLNFIEERTVGASLGADSIEAGKIASLVGAVGVLIFMVLAYGMLGIIANVALIANIALIVAILSTLGATLTLPGIAGIVLTMGMAVDANVLIYERIREERRIGRGVIQSFDAGFRTAFGTILDANITTMIAAIILFFVGTGPVRGFAVTLAIGIITTVFTAYTVTRMLVALWVKYKKLKEIPKRPVNMVPENTTFRFMRHRRFSFPFSIAGAIASIILFFAVSLNFGIDFKGGTLVELRPQSGVADVADVRSRLGSLDLGDVQVQNFGTEGDLLVRYETQTAGDGEAENANQAAQAKVRTALENDYEFRRVEIVGPTVSGELAIYGTIAVIAALLAIMVYIWFRFEWQFAVGAVVATLHDVLFTIGMFAILRLEFSLSSIAAILTIVGYSLNDTVVVYDRIRENLRKYKKMPIPELLDMSINHTLSRTILTSATTLVALLSLYFLGGEVLAPFTFAMIFGVIIGTYSSIFIAAPVLIAFKLRPGQVAGAESEAEKLAANREKAATANTMPIDLDD